MQETSDTILSMYEKMQITRSGHFKLLYTCNYFKDQNLKTRHDPQRFDLLKS